MEKPTGPTYWDYLQLDKLLTAQGGLEGDEAKLMPDELHFIVVHQVYELWFKLILRELRETRDRLAAPNVAEETVPYVVHHLGRVSEILKLMVQQWAVMETLTPQDFLAFRDKLIPASGFQSFQMRELELVLGMDDDQRLRYGGVDPVDHIRGEAKRSPFGASVTSHLDRARDEGTLRGALHDWLYRTPIQGSSPGDDGDAEAVASFLESFLSAHGAAQREQADRLVAAGVVKAEDIDRRFAATALGARHFLHADDMSDLPDDVRARQQRIRAGLLFIESYRELPLLAWPRLLIDAVVEVEEQFVLWRFRHARMTERTIGRRVGTGGSSGVDYLDKAAEGRIFPELWTVRSLLLSREGLPPLEKAEFYGFAS